MLIGFIAAMAMQSAGAQQPNDGAPLIVNPQWDRIPTADEIARFYPMAALKDGLGGRTVIVCAITASGTLRDCKVALEDPAGVGFGAAALDLATMFHMRSKTKDGVPVEGKQVRIPVRFILPSQARPDPRVCYAVAADAAEREPSLKNWGPAAFWGYQVLAQSAREGRKPSEAEQDLVEARRQGVGTSGKPNNQLNACLSIMPIPPR